VRQNLTLTIEGDLLREARKVALDRNTSVNQLVREFLERLVQEQGSRQAAQADIEDMFRTVHIEVGRRNWTRQDLHER
jgi:hypothetical protein